MLIHFFFFSSRFIIGTSDGRLSVYEYDSKECYMSTVISPNSNNGNQITCVKYSPKGIHIYHTDTVYFSKIKYVDER